MSSPTRYKIADYLEDALFLDPPEVFDDAILGIATRFNGLEAVAYDRSLCIDGLIASGMTHEEAEEWFEFNTAGAWVGERTPVFIDTRWAE